MGSGAHGFETPVQVWAVPGKGQIFLGAGTLEMQLCGSKGTEMGEGSGRGRGAMRGLREGGLSRGVKDFVGRGRLRAQVMPRGGPDS